MKTLKIFFVKKYFEPEIQIKLTKELLKFANSSIDISDGLIADLEKLINKQNLSYMLNLNSVPISKNLNKVYRWDLEERFLHESLRVKDFNFFDCIDVDNDDQNDIVNDGVPGNDETIDNSELDLVHEDMQWQPAFHGSSQIGKEAFGEYLKGWHDAMENVVYTPVNWLPGVLADTGLPDGSVRSYGKWTGVHTEI